MIKRRKFLKAASASVAGFVLPALVKPDFAFAETDLLQSPASQGFYFPHEADPHQRCLMQWPVSVDTYGRRELKRVQSAIARLARSVVKYEPVTMIASGRHHKNIQRLVRSKIEFLDIETDDLWARDSCPPILKNAKGELALSELNFNGWGNKQAHDNDTFVGESIGENLNLPRFNAGLVGEGGGVEQDGEGTLLAHASSWVNENRNPFSDIQIDTLMREALAAKQVIWAPGLKGQDITDYHIDSLARFVRPGLIVMQLPKERDTQDPFEKTAWQTFDILSKARDAKDRKIEIEVIHGPVSQRDKSPDFLSSYVNYYVCNGAVISAEYGDETADQKAKATLEKLYPDRKVEMVNVDAIARNGGGIHCATREIPETS